MRHIIIIITPVSIFVNSFCDYLYGFLYQWRERRAVRAYDNAAAAVHRYQHAQRLTLTDRLRHFRRDLAPERVGDRDSDRSGDDVGVAGC